MVTIIHIFDIAGVGSLYAKLASQMGLSSQCLYFKNSDPYHISAYYEKTGHTQGINGPKPLFLLKTLKYLLKTKPKIIHLHYHQRLIPLYWLVAKFLRAKLVFHYHGNDLRLHGYQLLVRKLADRVICVTPDLYHRGMRLMTNPIDPELFYYAPEKKRYGFYYQDRPVAYELLAHYLRQTDVFVEYKNFCYPTISKVTYEALAAGCQVIYGQPPVLLEPSDFEALFEFDRFRVIMFYEEVLQ